MESNKFMAPTIKHIREGFGQLFESMLDRNFRKTLAFSHWGERRLLPLVRTFLLGRYGQIIEVEVDCHLPSTSTGRGRLDFVVGGVAVELAVRKQDSNKASLSQYVNQTEIAKMMRHEGKAILVLFDFSDSPYTAEELKSYRNALSLGKGNHKKAPFNLAYFHVVARSEAKYDVISMNVRK